MSEVFLSTPSARRATNFRNADTLAPSISIHALREEGDPSRIRWGLCPGSFLSTPSARRATTAMVWRQTGAWYFYPRPPRGGRPPPPGYQQPSYQFLSTPSARRATAAVGLGRSCK